MIDIAANRNVAVHWSVLNVSVPTQTIVYVINILSYCMVEHLLN